MERIGSSSSNTDYRSKDVIEARLKEMIQRVDQKTKSNLNEEELLRACHALIAGVTTNPRFRHLKLLKVEEILFPNDTTPERPSSEFLQVLLSKWLELADVAYTYHDKGEELEDKLQSLLGEEYRLMRHCTNVETGGVGYFLTVDPKSKTLLIGIKGTSTMSEMITDCLATTIPHQCVPHSPFDLKAKDEQIGAHEGILASSIKLLEDLRPILDEKLEEGYSLQLVGHSLGAGAASVLAVLLRAQYPVLHQPQRLHAYCFATPPVLDHRAALRSKDFITAVVNRNDCVSRMAIANVEVLVRMLEGFNELVLKREGINSYWQIAKGLAFNEHIKFLNDEQFEELAAIMLQAQKSVQIEHKEHLYVPGKVHAMYGTLQEMPAKGQKAQVTVRPAIVDPAHTFLRYFEVNDRMLYDHTIASYQESLTGCISSLQQTEEEVKKDCHYYCVCCCFWRLRCVNQICCCGCCRARQRNNDSNEEDARQEEE